MTPQEILSKHKLNYSDLRKSSISYLSDVWLTEKYAIKIYGSNSAGFEKECWFYYRAAPFYAPAMIDYGEDYIILERIYGNSIYRNWHKLSPEIREDYARQIADIITDLTSRSFEGAEDIFPIPDLWEKHIKNRIMLLCTELDAAGKIPHGLSLSVREFTEEYWRILEDHEYGLCYSDLRYDNLLADSNGKVWLLDYETLCAAPKDYILDTFYRMSTSPLWDKNEENIQGGNTLMELLRKYAPELFSYPDIDKRIALYSLVYELDMLRYYPNDPLAIKNIKEAVGKF